MLTQRKGVVKYMIFDVGAPINTFINKIEELGDIATTDLNPYTNQKNINLEYKIINKTG